MSESFLSVGIDIGTSTTQLVFSRITVDDTASIVSVPMIKIVDKEIVYKSNIYFTPLLSPTEIDGPNVRKIIEEEYKKAKIEAKDVTTGAVIITGETARKKNANEVLNTLSGLAGDFVVATAGPDLEAIIAGKGANVHEFSKDKGVIVANLDVGGGTTNIAVFKNGNVIDTSCLDIGGRLIKIDKDRKIITYISEKIYFLAQSIGLEINVGDKADYEKLKKIAKRMISILEETLGLRKSSKELNTMITNQDLRRDYEIEYISFTGGVADYIHNTSKDIFQYGDIGIILGNSILNSNLVKHLKLYNAKETIRATVVGAGSHTTDISGSTIKYSEEVLPLKNIPILKLTEEDENLPYQEIEKIIADKLKWFSLDEDKQLVALAIKGVRNSNFEEVQNLANSIINGMKEILDFNTPLIVITENDMAKVLGQTLDIRLNNKKPIVCIDSIEVESGDYVDIGKPLLDGSVVPVIVKTLLLN
ncbi:ethanolamine ammonia-lyase reactivating factor EutA [Clostridium sp. Cult2]|uniref:ethanolamine ammonia-lyase reactivating factor EutA n=1 Tax=Clostridium sp. Cult2 TaxID=2079003 RepID=UPI001F2C64ED|nr:ethanolamine ammonia-lyase reactivating factor EutA [Clostridium sp. Cult2]MCF6466265.1 ethanolamine ammonia-lyase reactivating factor EutA [Clostridium sp. Cult2]